MGGGSVSAYAFTIPSLPPASSITIVNYGYIVGAGGAGGKGGVYYNGSPVDINTAGGPGGNALSVSAQTIIKNYGVIAGGGGGGSGGGSASVYYPGGGGGGGAGYTAGAGGLSYDDASINSCRRYGRHYRCNYVLSQVNGVQGQSGSLTNGGTGGGLDLQYGYYGGGVGGGIGQNGGNGWGQYSVGGGGGGGLGGYGGTSPFNYLPGGSPGYYVVGNSNVTWAVTGTVAGLVQ